MAKRGSMDSIGSSPGNGPKRAGSILEAGKAVPRAGSTLARDSQLEGANPRVTNRRNSVRRNSVRRVSDPDLSVKIFDLEAADRVTTEEKMAREPKEQILAALKNLVAYSKLAAALAEEIYRSEEWDNLRMVVELYPKSIMVQYQGFELIGKLSQEPRLVTFTISSLAKELEVSRIFQLLEDLRHVRGEVNRFHLNAAMMAASSSAQWRQALGTLRALHQFRETPDERSYSAAMAACSAERWPGALAAWSSSRDDLSDQDVVLLGVAMTSCGANRWVHCLQMLENLSDCQVQLNVVVFSTLISFLRSWTAASLSLSRMRQLWIEPNVVTYTAAMACGQWQLPLKICKMNTVTSNAKLNCLVSTSGHWDQAVETLLQMRCELQLRHECTGLLARCLGLRAGNAKPLLTPEFIQSLSSALG
eukprot:g22889.t1